MNDESSGCNVPKWILAKLAESLSCNMLKWNAGKTYWINRRWAKNLQVVRSRMNSGRIYRNSYWWVKSLHAGKQNKYVGLVDGNLVQKATSGPDILRQLGRDKWFSPRILDQCTGFCSLSIQIREKQIHQEGRLNWIVLMLEQVYMLGSPGEKRGRGRFHLGFYLAFKLLHQTMHFLNQKSRGNLTVNRTHNWK